MKSDERKTFFWSKHRETCTGFLVLGVLIWRVLKSERFACLIAMFISGKADEQLGKVEESDKVFVSRFLFLPTTSSASEALFHNQITKKQINAKKNQSIEKMSTIFKNIITFSYIKQSHPCRYPAPWALHLPWSRMLINPSLSKFLKNTVFKMITLQKRNLPFYRTRRRTKQQRWISALIELQTNHQSKMWQLSVLSPN